MAPDFGLAAEDYARHRAGFPAFDAALAQLLAARFPGEVLAVPHRVFAVLARAPGRP